MPDQPLLAALGVLLVGTAILDMIRTALRVDRRGGPVTGVLAGLLWRGFHGGGSQRRAGPPAATGIVITLTVVFSWVLLSLAGWSLLFMSDAEAVVHATTGQPAGAWTRVYFTSYTLSTLGLGDYVPVGTPFRLAVGIASGFGFGVATLVITYLTSVVGAVGRKREMARWIWALGGSPQEVVRRAWDGKGFDALEDHLLALLPSLQSVIEQHAANPLIAYFKSSDLRNSDVPAVAMLHDALAIIESSDAHLRLRPLTHDPVCSSIDAYLHALPGATRDPEELDTPPWPDVTDLRAEGIPVRPLADLPRSDASLYRRRRLGAVMHHQGWAWQDFEEATGQGD